MTNVFAANKRLTRASAFSSFLCGSWWCILPLREFTFHPYGSMARVPTRAIVYLGRGLRRTCRRPERTGEGGPVPTAKQPDQNSGDRIRIGLPYQNRIKTVVLTATGCRLSESRRPKLLKALGAGGSYRGNPSSLGAGGRAFKSPRPDQ